MRSPAVRALSRARAAACLVAVSVALAGSDRALAAGPLGSDGEPIATSSYAIDLFQGPVLATSRTTGLAGAVTALAEGVDGNRANAATPAVRAPWAVRWFSPTLAFALTFPGTLSRTDFDNDGQAGFAYGDFYFLTVGANAALGDWGFGGSLDAQHYKLTGATAASVGSRSLSVQLERGHVLGARAFFDGQLVVGAGLQTARLGFTANAPAEGSNEQLFSMTSTRVQAGALWAPARLPMRLALAGRGPGASEPNSENSVTPDAAGDTVVGPFYLPARLDLPWELELGAVWQFGRRPLNVPWQNPRRALAPLWHALDETREARLAVAEDPASVEEEESEWLREARRAFLAERRAAYRALPRVKLLVTGSLLLSGPVEDAVGFESFLRQSVQRSGRRATLTPRLGFEGEPVAHLLKLRAGTYLEPSRFEVWSPRWHGTFGLDVHLFRFGVFGLLDRETRWRIGGHLDVARQYLAWGLSAGIWR